MSSFRPVRRLASAIACAIALAITAAACSKELPEPWREMGVPMFGQLEVQRSSPDSLELAFDPARSETDLLEQVASEVTARGWIRIADPSSTRTRPKVRFAKSAAGPELTAYTGHGTLLLELRAPWPDLADAIAFAQRRPDAQRTDVEGFAARLEKALAAAAQWRQRPRDRCPDDRLRGLVPAEAARHPPGYLAAALAAGARPPLARLLGLRSAPTAEIIGATGIDAAWMQAQEVERAGVVLVFSGAGFVQDAELVTSDRFRGGVTSGEFVVVELASAMPLCGGVFTSTSSREVIASQGQEDSALEADLSGQAMSGIDRSLLGISSYLRYQSRL